MSDQSWEQLLVLAILGAVMTVVLVVAVVLAMRMDRAEGRRLADLRRWADDNGWSYTARDDSLVEWFVGVPFDEGRHQRASHVLRGRRRGRDVVVYEYSFVKGSHPRSQRTYECRVVAVQAPARRPWLQVMPESAGRKLLDKVGVRDLQLENEDFNKTFHIQTGSERFAYDVLHPRMMASLLDDPALRQVAFRFEQWHLVTWASPGDECYLTPVIRLVDHLIDILEMVPAFVWRYEYAPEDDQPRRPTQ